MDNIRYGKLDATDEEVIEVAKLIKAHDFISKLKMVTIQMLVKVVISFDWRKAIDFFC